MRRLFTTVALVSWLGLIPGVARGKVDFPKSIQPIFEASCLECHGPEKQKGKLRLDLKERALKQGDPGEVVVPGVAGKSELYRRIILADDDEDRMPNKGKSLTKEQTDLIRDWINQGADWPDGLVLNFKGADKLQVSELRPAPKPSKAEIKALTALEASHIRVLPVADNMGWHEANLRPLGASLDDAALAPIGHVVSLIHLNLAGTKVTDASLVYLRGLKNLTRLHLEKTRVTDAGLANLRGLTELTYLNLYGTAITDAGLKRLYGLKNLQAIYLWDTKTTEEGMRQLRGALPKLRVMSGSAPGTFPFQAVEKPPTEKAETTPPPPPAAKPV